MLSLYLEVWSRVESVISCAGNLPFGATAQCKDAVQMPIEGTVDGANGRSRHKGHCRAVVALLQQWGRLQLSAEGFDLRGTGGGMECLAGDAVRGLLCPADASPIGRRALGVG